MRLSKTLAAFLVCTLVSVSAIAFAKKETRSDYINRAESEFTRYENEVAQLTTERNTLPRDSQRYKELTSKIDDMAEHVKEGREALKELREDPSVQWEPRRKSVENHLVDLRKLSEERHSG